MGRLFEMDVSKGYGELLNMSETERSGGGLKLCRVACNVCSNVIGRDVEGEKERVKEREREIENYTGIVSVLHSSAALIAVTSVSLI